MDHAEQHLVTPGRQFEAYLAAPLPGDGELARRIALGDAALHPVLVAETRRSLSGRVGELIVAPDYLELSPHRRLHLTRSQPLAPQFAFRQIRPHPLDRTRQQTFDL